MHCYFRNKTEFYVAVDNKGGWPNLKLLQNGELGAMIYNHPSHGYGDDSGTELYISSDGGRSFQFRSLVSSLENDPPGAIRMQKCFGVNSEGHLIAIISGYQQGQKPPYLPLQLCISKDNGVSWQRRIIDNLVPHGGVLVPYGNIIPLSNGELVCSMYGMSVDKKDFHSILYSSEDGGESWLQKTVIGNNLNEMSLMFSEKKGILYASGRTTAADRMDGVLPHGGGEKLYQSRDCGQTWSDGKLLSPQGQENSHLLELNDGRLLCCLTSRIPGLFGVVYRISEDGGETWSAHESLITIGANDWRKTDAGYPSSVQLADGTIITAYYFGPKQAEYAEFTTPWHQRYHMGVARWRI